MPNTCELPDLRQKTEFKNKKLNKKEENEAAGNKKSFE